MKPAKVKARTKATATAKAKTKAKPATRRRLKNPRGGLTAAGRAWFHRKQGSNLKPGVRHHGADMTPQDLRRKGSWAVRFYGREGALPPLVKNGGPTRFALTAAAWGEPVPKTVAAARRIAAKGRRLLARYERLQTTRKPRHAS